MNAGPQGRRRAGGARANPFTLSLSHTLFHTHSLSLSNTHTLSLSHTFSLTHTLSLPLSHTRSLSPTHTHPLGWQGHGVGRGAGGARADSLTPQL